MKDKTMQFKNKILLVLLGLFSILFSVTAQNCGQADFSYTLDGTIVRLTGKSSLGDTAKYYWTFGNGASSEGRESKYQYEKPGEYQICLKVYTSGCTVSECKSVKILPVITVGCALKVEFQTKVDGTTGIFLASSNDPKAKYYWHVGGQNVQYEGNEIKIPFEKEGIYEVCLVGVDSAQTCKVQLCKKVEIVKNCNLGVDFGFTIDGFVVKLLGKSIVGTNAKYSWSFGDGISDDGIEVKHQYEKAGNYEICLKVVTPDCIVPICKKVQIGSISDTCSLKISYEYKIDGNTVYVNANSNDEKALYYWVVTGQNRTFEGKETKIAFEKSGIYEVCLIGVDGSKSCKVQVCKKIEVNIPCNLGADFSIVVDSNRIVRVVGKSAAGDSVRYYWTFGNGMSADGREAKVQYEKAGEYEICLKVVKGLLASSVDQACIQTICKKVTIIVPVINVCELKVEIDHRIDGNTGIFIARSNNDVAKYVWFIDGQTKLYEGREVKIPFERSGVYEVCVKAYTSETCKVQVCKKIEVNIPCNLGADFSIVVDSNRIVRVVGKSVAGDSVRYYWTFGNGMSADGREAKVQYEKAGEYEICLRVVKGLTASSLDQACIQTICKKVTIIVPVINVCELKVEIDHRIDGNTGIFIARSNNDGAKYVWFIDGQTKLYEGREVKIPFERSGVYEVCVKAYTSETCKVQVCKKIEINIPCDLGADFSYTIENNIVKVSAKSNGGDSVKYYWTFSTGVSVEGKEAVFKYEKAGDYQMCLKVVKTGVTSANTLPCIQTVCKNIGIKSTSAVECKLAPDFTYKTEGNTVIFTGSSVDEKATYFWYGNDQKIDLAGKMVRYQFDKAASYEVCMVVVNGSQTCKDQVCKKITVGNRINIFPNPTADFINVVVNEDISRAVIYNQMNQIVLSTNLYDSYGNIDITGLKEGMYLVNIQLSNGEVISKRFYKK
ncbi:MAG: PKD domain-containing protein [Saprospiraceae bacterium]|nr:PKD domain-containing protein [Saprospiraceae bacterium]